MRYLSELKPEQVKRLYYLREGLNKKGNKDTMAGLVRDAVNYYLSSADEEAIKLGEKLTNQKEKRRTRKSKTELRQEGLSFADRSLLTDGEL